MNDHPPSDDDGLRWAVGALQLSPSQAKALQHFELADPFNDGVRLRGFLCRIADHRYGALALTHVDGREARQLIAATPKLHYPFDKEGVFSFPAVQRMWVTDKLDGTNVLAFRYVDGDGNTRTTFKLRLSPVLRDGPHGDFLQMWKELLQRHPQIVDVVDKNDVSLSFEMYGSRNHHLIHYDAPLELALLFGVSKDFDVVPLAHLDAAGLPTAPLLFATQQEQSPVDRYQQLRTAMQQQVLHVDDGYTGTEGAVFTVEDTDGAMRLYKCKPAVIEEIHWARGIHKDAVLVTCKNVFESNDELTFDTLQPLLLEEYSQSDVDGFRSVIDVCIGEVNAAKAFEQRVLRAYADTGLSFADDRAAVMRLLAATFSKHDMKHIYSVLERHT